MKRYLISFLLAGFLLVVGLAMPLKASAALFDGAKGQACGGVALDGTTTTCADNSKQLKGVLDAGLTIFSIVVGIIAVIMVIIGGLKFVTSGGDANNTNSARNTVIYAIVGLVIVAFAQIIVRFVLNKTGQ